MSFFESLQYPDNAMRYDRLVQLISDVGSLAYTLQQDKEIIRSKLADANAAIKIAYDGLIPGGVPIETITVSQDSIAGNWIEVISGVITPVITYPLVDKALTHVYKSFLLKTGRISEGAFLEVAGLPRWVRLGSLVGGATTVATIAVSAIVESITGGIRRDHLRKGIREVVLPRVELKQSVMISEKVKETLTAVTMSFNSVAGLVNDKYTLDKIAQNLIDQNQTNVNGITIDATMSALEEYDRDRKAWVNEDYHFTTDI